MFRVGEERCYEGFGVDRSETPRVEFGGVRKV